VQDDERRAAMAAAAADLAQPEAALNIASALLELAKK
jgi:UDP-N-acetylglucosamine:LPS N-acetylglucosamine transferase